MGAFSGFRKPSPGNFGTVPIFTSKDVGVGGTTIGGTATTRVVLPLPYLKMQLKSLAMNVDVAALSNGGTVKAQYFKRTGSAATPADVALTASTSIEADVVTVLEKNYKITITAVDGPNTIFQPGDLLVCDIVAASTIDTSPVMAVTATLNAMV